MIDFYTHIFPDEVAAKALPQLARVCGKNHEQMGNGMDCLFPRVKPGYHIP